MAEIKWTNVNDSGANAAMRNYLTANQGFRDSIMDIGRNLVDFTNTLNQGLAGNNKVLRDKNTADVLNRMARADTAADYEALKASKEDTAEVLRQRYGDLIDMDKVNAARGALAKSVYDRAQSVDNVKDYDPTQVALLHKYNNAIQRGDTAEAQSLYSRMNTSLSTDTANANALSKARADNFSKQLGYLDTQEKQMGTIGQLRAGMQSVQQSYSKLLQERDSRIATAGSQLDASQIASLYNPQIMQARRLLAQSATALNQAENAYNDRAKLYGKKPMELSQAVNVESPSDVVTQVVSRANQQAQFNEPENTPTATLVNTDEMVQPTGANNSTQPMRYEDAFQLALQQVKPDGSAPTAKELTKIAQMAQAEVDKSTRALLPTNQGVQLDSPDAASIISGFQSGKYKSMDDLMQQANADKSGQLRQTLANALASVPNLTDYISQSTQQYTYDSTGKPVLGANEQEMDKVIDSHKQATLKEVAQSELNVHAGKDTINHISNAFVQGNSSLPDSAVPSDMVENYTQQIMKNIPVLADQGTWDSKIGTNTFEKGIRKALFNGVPPRFIEGMTKSFADSYGNNIDVVDFEKGVSTLIENRDSIASSYSRYHNKANTVTAAYDNKVNRVRIKAQGFTDYANGGNLTEKRVDEISKEIGLNFDGFKSGKALTNRQEENVKANLSLIRDWVNGTGGFGSSERTSNPTITSGNSYGAGFAYASDLNKRAMKLDERKNSLKSQGVPQSVQNALNQIMKTGHKASIEKALNTLAL